jgi:hypothetical protein
VGAKVSAYLTIRFEGVVQNLPRCILDAWMPCHVVQLNRDTEGNVIHPFQHRPEHSGSRGEFCFRR